MRVEQLQRWVTYSYRRKLSYRVTKVVSHVLVFKTTSYFAKHVPQWVLKCKARKTGSRLQMLILYSNRLAKRSEVMFGSFLWDWDREKECKYIRITFAARWSISFPHSKKGVVFLLSLKKLYQATAPKIRLPLGHTEVAFPSKPLNLSKLGKYSIESWWFDNFCTKCFLVVKTWTGSEGKSAFRKLGQSIIVDLAASVINFFFQGAVLALPTTVVIYNKKIKKWCQSLLVYSKMSKLL